MKRRITGFLFPVFACGLLFVTLSPTNAAADGFKLLTLNLLFSGPTTSLDSDGNPRFYSIADFIVDQDIDCVLFQEVVGGQLAKQLGLTETLNSALELKSRLSDDYKLRYRLVNGIPSFSRSETQSSVKRLLRLYGRLRERFLFHPRSPSTA